MSSQSTKETQVKSAKLRRMVVKEFNDELLNLKIILEKIQKRDAI